MLFAYFQLGLLIDGADGVRAPVSPDALAAAIARLEPTLKELVFLRRLCRACNAGALLSVVSSFCRPTARLMLATDCMPVLLEADLDEDAAHNARALANFDRLAVIIRDQLLPPSLRPLSAAGSRASPPPQPP